MADTPTRTFIITGASGMIGSALRRYLVGQGHEVRVLCRRQPSADGEYFWDPYADEIDAAVFQHAHVLVHLSGENVASGRWTTKRKQRIIDSRIKTAECLTHAMHKHQVQLDCILQASGVGFYGSELSDDDHCYTEADEPGSGFLAEVCQQWEQSAAAMEPYAKRVLRLRLGVVLGKQGGLIQKVRTPFQCFLGGHLGNGQQMLPWISCEDAVRIVLWLSSQTEINGPVNLVAPEQINNDQCMRGICKQLQRPCWAHVPTFMIALLFGQMGREILLSSLRVKAQVLLDNDYEFMHPTLEACLHDVFTDG